MKGLARIGRGLLVGMAAATLAAASAGATSPPKLGPQVPAIQQYVEVLPTSGGDVATGAGGHRPLPTALRKQIDGQGGSDAASLKSIAATAVTPLEKHRPTSKRMRGPGHEQATHMPTGGRPVAAPVTTATGGGSRTLLFVLGALLLTTLAAAGVAVRRTGRR
jgi:hypothetical protein